jgi:methylmalonyl-CoA mutase cobalamin-binding domain/chain
VDVLKKYMTAGDISQLGGGKVVIGTALGDIHDLGKTLVVTALEAAGFEVFDLGIDVPTQRFIDKATESNADFIGVSSLLSVSATYMEYVVTELVANGLRDRFFVIVGGGPVSPDWAERIKSDGWGDQMEDAVDLCKTLLMEKKEQAKPPRKKTLCISKRYNIRTCE